MFFPHRRLASRLPCPAPRHGRAPDHCARARPCRHGPEWYDGRRRGARPLTRPAFPCRQERPVCQGQGRQRLQAAPAAAAHQGGRKDAQPRVEPRPGLFHHRRGRPARLASHSRLRQGRAGQGPHRPGIFCLLSLLFILLRSPNRQPPSPSRLASRWWAWDRSRMLWSGFACLFPLPLVPNLTSLPTLSGFRSRRAMASRPRGSSWCAWAPLPSPSFRCRGLRAAWTRASSRSRSTTFARCPAFSSSRVRMLFFGRKALTVVNTKKHDSSTLHQPAALQGL